MAFGDYMNSPRANDEMGYRIGVFGHYGHHNMGDEAITEAVIQNLRRRCLSVRLSGFSMDPEDTTRRYGIPAYRIRRQGSEAPENAVDGKAARGQETPGTHRFRNSAIREYLKRFALLRYLVRSLRFALRLPQELWRESVFLRDSYRIAKGVDAFIVAGSNQFLDNFGGVWGYPYTVLKWTVLARCAGARIVFLSVGAGPIDSIWSRILVRASLSLADYASFRDAGSRRLIEWAGSRKSWRVCPDLARSLEVRRQPARQGDRLPTVAINPMPVYDRRSWCEPDDARYERYVGQLAQFVSRLMRERFPVFFFTTQPSDNSVIDDVVARIDGRPLGFSGDLKRKTSRSVDEVMAVLGSADIVVATRYHGTVLGLHAGRPVLGICYYRKTREVLQTMGQEAYAVDIDGLDHEDLWRRFQLLASNRVAEARTIERLSEAVETRLAAQYDDVLKILGVPVECKGVP